MTYEERMAIYNRIKKQIANEAKTPQEYEKRIKALAKKLGV